VRDKERSASEKASADLTDTDRFMVNKAMSPKVMMKDILYSLLSSQ
jgi:hypothetical protein